MIRLYMDENVDSAITRGVRERGIDVLTVQEDGREGLDDPLVLDRAMELNRIVFSQDTDFLIEGARRQTEGVPFAGIIFGRQRKAAIGFYVQDLELIAQAEEPENYIGVVEYLPL